LGLKGFVVVVVVVAGQYLRQKGTTLGNLKMLASNKTGNQIGVINYHDLYNNYHHTLNVRNNPVSRFILHSLNFSLISA